MTMIMRQGDKETMRRYLSGQLITEPDSRESTNRDRLPGNLPESRQAMQMKDKKTKTHCTEPEPDPDHDHDLANSYYQ